MSGPRLLLGLDFGGTKIAVATSSADGVLVDRSVLRTDAAAGADQALRRAVQEGRRLLERSGAPPAAVGVVCPGIALADRVLLAPNVPGWGEVAMAERVRAGLAAEEADPGPLVVGNDVKAGALAEARHGALRGSRTGLYVNLGTGFCVSVVVDGQVLDGAHGAGGEVGYQLRRAGEPGYADGHAPVEETVAGLGLGARASQAAGRPLTATEALRSTQPQVVAALAPALDLIDLTLANACCLVDPDAVVLGGGMVAAADILVPRLDAALARAVPFPPSVGTARFVDDAPLIGALTLAADAAGWPGWAPV